MKKTESITDIFARTLNNCLFYEREGKKMHLLNEIGVLRGVAYCMKTAGICPHGPEFNRMIALQVDMMKGEPVGYWETQNDPT